LRIRSLEIFGFKSFVEKTRFEFRPGITGVVGPNGCGKSNVVDAIRWAMGEQSPRRLRGKGMEDVIFAGSEDRPPVGLAEVVLAFDNSAGDAPAAFAAYSEIQVARRLYRSGESEYLINKVPVRLRDVQDFFRDTGIGTRGYTIVEQGRIAEIVSAKPEDRRALIEEAAGISKYKARRQEAERKLEATEQNLVRVNDVLGEIRRQIHSIERQAKKAARYRRLRDLQRLLELSLAADERSGLLGEVADARRRALAARDAATAAEARLAECEALFGAKRVAVAEGERAAVAKNEALFQARSRIQELESRIAYERRERAALAEANVAREREREELLAQRAAADEEAARLADELGGLEAALAAEARGVGEAEAEARGAAEALRERERERDAASAALVEVLTRVARTEDRRAACEDRLDELDRRLRTAEEQLEVQGSEAAQLERQSRDLEEGLRNLLAERDRLMGALRDAIERHAQRGEEARAAQLALREAGERCETKRARLASLEEILARREDVGEAARHLLAQDPDTARGQGIRALVRDVLEVDREFEAAVEAALAERAQGLVMERAEGALAAIEALHGAAAGHGVFVLEPDEEAPAFGFVPLGRPLLECVRVRPGFEAVARRLLGGVHLVEDLGEAVRLYGRGRIPASFVTSRGDLLARDGVMRGGAGVGSGILARAREVRELASEVEALAAQLAGAERHTRETETALGASSDELENLRSRHHTAVLAVANHEKDLERSRERGKAIGEAREGRAEERSSFLAEARALREELVRSDGLLAAGREERARRQRELESVGLRIGSAGRELARLEALAGERRAEHRARAEGGERLRASLETARHRAGELAEWAARRQRETLAAEARREELGRSLAEAETGLAAQLEAEEAARRQAEEARDVYERLAAEARTLEEEGRELRVRLGEERERAQQVELELRERELRLVHLEEQVRDRWGVDLASWKAPVPALGGELPLEDPAAELSAEGTPEAGEEAEESEARETARAARAQAEALALDVPGRRARLEEVRGGLEALGEVNLGAIEEHEELRERFRFLAEQKADLETSIGQLRDAIQRINRTSRKRFRETFEAVDARFQQNFPRLFRGGKARLSLTEHEDVLEAGIEIMAQPPGKRLQIVNLLSGGEKTMTALALLVSVFQVRPSPFFLLDEVDAALDDANVGRFNEVVLELARDSQFLLITHNKRTIEVADLLYGVTMEEKGVSKLVSVELR
jgi:chromosome segregation protein